MSRQAAGVLPLDQEQTNNLQRAVTGLSPAQLQWVSGYAAGLAAADPVVAVNGHVQADAGRGLTVLYGSQTGNGEALAAAIVRQAVQAGFSARSISLADFKPANLKREKLLTLVISTHGEGEPPDDAELFYEFLLSKKAPQLPELTFSVLALGDSSYVNFCQTGREFDARLAELGATRMLSLLECDLDYDDPAAEWTARLVKDLPNHLDKGREAKAPHLRSVETVSPYSKTNPFAAEVLVNQKITGTGSSKDVRHIELSLEGSALAYEPGDSLAVLAHNPPQLIRELLDVLDLDTTNSVQLRGEQLALGTALAEHLEITVASLGFLRSWAELANDNALSSVLQDSSLLQDFVETHQVIDVVTHYPAETDAQQFVDMLRPLSARSYSISSSPDANPDEVHLTVAAVNYKAHGREHWGAASTHLARAAEGATVSVYIDRNSRFRLPADEVPIIMIGPGTGVAPFRAFVEQRLENGAGGDNWLFFGDRNFSSDFLYQLEWQRYLKQGVLARLTVAFSRDQQDKIYVQDRIREQRDEMYRWLENGAAVYVCGDAKRMASDVHAALLDVYVEAGGLTAEAAAERLLELRSEGRYQRDVY